MDPAANKLGVGKTIIAVGRAVGGVYKSNGKNHLVLEELLNAVRAQRAVGRCRLTLSYSR